MCRYRFKTRFSRLRKYRLSVRKQVFMKIVLYRIFYKIVFYLQQTMSYQMTKLEFIVLASEVYSNWMIVSINVIIISRQDEAADVSFLGKYNRILTRLKYCVYSHQRITAISCILCCWCQNQVCRQKFSIKLHPWILHVKKEGILNKQGLKNGM